MKHSSLLKKAISAFIAAAILITVLAVPAEAAEPIEAAEEAVEAKKSITILGGKVNRQIELYLPNSDIYRNLFIIDKISKCPNKYPRKAGLPSKEPLR